MKIHRPFLVAASGFLFAKSLQLLFWTLRLHVETTPDADPYASSGPTRYLYSVWHDSIIMAAFGGKHVRTVALTSHHRDGSFVASVLKAIGVPAIRGSTGNRGGNAVREILTAATNCDIVMTPDGPRGPYREMSRGIVFLASRSGRPIVPTAFACCRAWTIRGSWTDLVIPQPFSDVILLAGDPIRVPMKVTRVEMDQIAAEVQARMDELNAAATSRAAGVSSAS